MILGSELPFVFQNCKLTLVDGMEQVGDFSNILPNRYYKFSGYQKWFNPNRTVSVEIFLEECVTVENLTQEHLSEDNSVRFAHEYESKWIGNDEVADGE